MNRSLALLLAGGVLALAGCTATPAVATPPVPAPPATPGRGANADLAIAVVPRSSPAPAQAAGAAGAINAFGANLYRRAAAGAEGSNLVFSPASVALALAMTRPGARGATATEIDTVLHGLAGAGGLDPINALDLALAARNRTVEASDGPKTVTLRIANAPFGQRGTPFEAAYLDALASAFGAGLRLVDYRADTEGARRTINGWVSDQTEKRIPELLAKGVLKDITRLTLVNAIYLKAPWQRPFAEKESTQDAPFTRSDGSIVQVPLMTTQGEMPYVAGDGWRAVELAYAGNELAMVIVVPDTLAAFESSLDGDRLESITGALAERKVALGLPRFSIESKTDLAKTLAAMGMPSGFDGARADFSGITTAEPLFIAAVIHQANIDVDEAGTEAAAATAVVMEAGAAPGPAEEPIRLTVDRPFLFLLRDRATGAILFMGRVTDPAIGR